MKKPTCKTCYYGELVNTDHGDMIECHRYAPGRAIAVQVQALQASMYPDTKEPDDWCGEHPDHSYWVAHQRGTLRWVLWQLRKGTGIVYLAAVSESKSAVSTLGIKKALLFNSLQEAEDTAKLVHKEYYGEEEKYHPTPVIMKVITKTWSA